MVDTQLISIIVGLFIGLGTLIAGCGFAYAQFKTGGDKAKDDLIKTLRDTAIAEKAEKERLAQEKITLVGSHQSQLNELNAKIGKLQGLYESSEKARQEYLQILQGRDPAQQAFMDIVLKQIEQNEHVQPEAMKYMTDSIKILGEIKVFMENLNKNSSANKKFLEEVGDATKKNKGKVLRKEV